MRFTNLFAVATMCATTTATAYAQTERELSSRDHGSATLNVAVDGTSVFIELDTPWNNLVGFEYQPTTTEQHAMVDEAIALLNQPEKLFVFDNGDCASAEITVTSDMGSDDHDDEHHDDKHDDEHDEAHGDKHDDHHDDEHGDKHDDDHDDEHGDEHDEHHDDEHGDKHDEHHDDEHGDEHDDAHGDEHDHSEATHSTAMVSYAFECGNLSQLSSIDVQLFKEWSGFEDIDVQLIGPGGQALEELNAQQTQINISQIQ